MGISVLTHICQRRVSSVRLRASPAAKLSAKIMNECGLPFRMSALNPTTIILVVGMRRRIW